MKKHIDRSTGAITAGLECGSAPFVRPPWCRPKVVTFNDEPSMTQQVHKDLTDVNVIVDRFARTGYLPGGTAQARYADVTGMQGDFTELVERSRRQVAEAKAFMDDWKPPEPPSEPPVTSSPE